MAARFANVIRMSGRSGAAKTFITSVARGMVKGAGETVAENAVKSVVDIIKYHRKNEGTTETDGRVQTMDGYVTLHIIVPSGNCVILVADTNLSLRDCITHLSKNNTYQLTGNLSVYYNDLPYDIDEINNPLSLMWLDSKTCIQIVKWDQPIINVTQDIHHMFLTGCVPTYVIDVIVDTSDDVLFDIVLPNQDI